MPESSSGVRDFTVPWVPTGMNAGDVQFAALTDVGRKRRHNEDFVGHFEPSDADELLESGRLYIVADGVGGQEQGGRSAVGHVAEWEVHQGVVPGLA